MLYTEVIGQKHLRSLSPTAINKQAGQAPSPFWDGGHCPLHQNIAAVKSPLSKHKEGHVTTRFVIKNPFCNNLLQNGWGEHYYNSGRQLQPVL